MSSISFTLNGEKVEVTDVSPSLTLIEWLRSQPGLTGTKKMCGEGGCGCCVVSATMKNPLTQKLSTIAINSCLCPLYSVNGWTITTVEGIGSSRDGFHPIQEKIASYNGSQCGYCTPGFVMCMYSLLQQNDKRTQQEIEDNFDGNICRCTGYRPILDAMKSFAVDSHEPEIIDIEDINPNKRSACLHKKTQWITHPCSDGDSMWYQPTKLSEVFDIFEAQKQSKIQLVCGNTGKGVFANMDVDVYIDLKRISELYIIQSSDTYISIGAAVSLNNLIEVLIYYKDKSSTFSHLADHLKKVANMPVRNIASWAGNLMLTHDHDNFPSDVFTIMEAAGATVTVATANGTGEYPLWDLLSLNMSNSVIVSLQIPYSNKNTWFRSFKVMPRAQDSCAYVNAGFCMEVDPSNHIVKSIPSFVFGGVKEHTISASSTEAYMLGKCVLDVKVLKNALHILDNEIEPNVTPGAASVEFRKNCVLSLFYKFILATIEDKIDSKYKSAAIQYIRPVSKGSQSYDTDSSLYPVNQPMPKLTATLQASGEAEYTTDIPTQFGELAAAFVITTQGNAKIINIDDKSAMSMPGAIQVITAKDIPKNGENNFLPFDMLGFDSEPVFATDVSQYAGQVVAMVIADTQEHANQMAQAVTVKYQSMGKLILTIKDAIAANSFYDEPGTDGILKIGDANDAISKSDHVISGEVSCGSQYHVHMETHAALVTPEDDGYTVYSSTQWVTQVQFAVAAILGIPNNKVNASVKRVGGGYGAKITRSAQTAAACALGAYLTRRPVRMHMDLETNMKSVGKRFPYYAKYTAGCTKDGILNGIKIDMYTDAGCCNNDNSIWTAVAAIDNVYKCPNWLVTPKSCKTHTCSNTACRAPGFVPGIFITESILDQVSRSLKMDVEQVKEANMYKPGDISYTADTNGLVLTYCNIRDLWKQIYETAEVEERKKQIVEYNKANRWRKRGLSLVPIKYGITWNTWKTTILVSVYSGDGTVSVMHGGVEVGQGINTKVAQVAAKTLGISLDHIIIKPSNVLVNANGDTTGGSITSELSCLGVIKACEALKERLDKVKGELEKGGAQNPSWLDIVTKAYLNGVDLSSRYFVYGESKYCFAYNAYGVTCAEVEVDVLTGQTEVKRVDILYDCGQSINPELDVGQVEGAFTMGLGYWLMEKIAYAPDSGQLLTCNTWAYKPPSSKDIPEDFRITLLKNAPNPLGILRSKAVGEPPQTMSCAVLFAVKRAIESARQEIGNDDLFSLSAPATIEDIQLKCLLDLSQFVF